MKEMKICDCNIVVTHIYLIYEASFSFLIGKNMLYASVQIIKYLIYVLYMAITTNRPSHRATDVSGWGPTFKKKLQHSSSIHITYYLEFNLGQ